MRIFKSTMALALGAMVSFSALAHPGHSPEEMGKDANHFSLTSPFTDSNLPHLIVKAIHGNLPSIELIESDYMDKKSWLVFHYMHHIDTWSDKPIKASDKSYFMVYLLKQKFPKAKTYWEDSKEWNGLSVSLSNGLIDPETVPFGHSDMKERKGQRTTYLEATPFIESASFAMTNRHRMRSGLPAIGPDNRQMVLCRLLQDRDATYYEMAQSDAVNLITETQSGMNLDQACLSQSLTKSYWKNRATDFETKYGEELSKD